VHRSGAAAFSFFGVQIQILVDAIHDRGLQASNLVNFVKKIVQLAVDGGQKD